MLAQEAGHPTRVPERVPVEEALVDHRRVVVVCDRGRDEPALPARLRRPVGEVDVLDVVAEAGIPAADLFQHRAAQQQTGAAEEPVALHRLGRTGAVVGDLVPVGIAEQPQRRPAPDRPEHGREPAQARLPGAVGPEHERSDEAGARVCVGEADELRDGVRLGVGVGVGDKDVVAARRSGAEVDVRREREWPLVLEHAGAEALRADAAGPVRDHDELVDLRRERRQRALELAGVAVRDDDGGDRHRPSASR